MSIRVWVDQIGGMHHSLASSSTLVVPPELGNCFFVNSTHGTLLHLSVRATLPSALNVINASAVGKLVQLVTASRLILYHEGRVDPMKDECHYQIKH